MTASRAQPGRVTRPGSPEPTEPDGQGAAFSIAGARNGQNQARVCEFLANVLRVGWSPGRGPAETATVAAYVHSGSGEWWGACYRPVPKAG